MKLIDFPLIKITIFFLIGIVIGYSTTLQFSISILFVIIAAPLIVAFYIDRRKTLNALTLTIFILIVSVCLGYLTYNLHDKSKFKNHYSQLPIDLRIAHNFQVKITKKLKPVFGQNRYIADLKSIDKSIVQGNILVNLPIDSIAKTAKVDDFIFFYGYLNEVKPPLNPGQFNYKEYLEKQYIYHQANVGKGYFQLTPENHSFFGTAAKVRTEINASLADHKFSSAQLAIINALLLGQREDISTETYNSYANAGVIHILAVSGLHVGIILLILQFLFRPLERLPHGKVFKLILIIFLLWCFALIAGMSASVTRAVTMFSFIAFGLNLKRRVNIYNTLACSVLILLLFKPKFLFDVGFQLSYLAVIGIVVFQPKIYEVIYIKWKVLNYFWKILSVTLAAQLAVLPLSLYYFHQVPGLFFISNLLILPFLGLILGYGILVIALSVLGWLPSIFAEGFGFLIDTMNKIVDFTASKEDFLFQNISFDAFNLLSAYVLLSCLIGLIYRKNTKWLIYLLVSIVFLQVSFLRISSYENEKFIIFNKTAETYIGHIRNQNLNLYCDYGQPVPTLLKDFQVKYKINQTAINPLKNVYNFKGSRILIVDSSAVYQTGFKPDLVLLSHSPKINLNRLLDSLSPRTVIADASNYKTYIERWKESCKKRKIPFHATAEKGAYILED